MAARRNLFVAAGLVAFVGCTASVPWFVSQRMFAGKNLQQSDKALTGSQVQRGAYMNTGSTDIGPDPNWDFKNGKYRGRTVNIKG